MALPFFNWSRTAASNATADSTINWAEGQLPSTVNDSARAMMASTAAYRDDVAGAITTGGSATAYTVTSYQVFSSLAAMAGQMIAFVPHATNTNAVGVDVTLNVDGLGAKSIRMAPSVALPNGTLVLGTPYIVTYNNSDAVFYLRNMTNPYAIPLGGGIDFWGTTAPNTSFAFPAGQAISRTTYATLFSIMSTTYGVGDGSTTFNLPDKTGRVSAMKEASATRLTATYFGASGATMGSVGGGESHTLTTAELASHAHTGTTIGMSANANHSHTYDKPTLTASQSPGGAFAEVNTVTAGSATSTTNIDHSHDFTSNSAGSGNAHAIVQPTIICNYIIRII